MRTSIKTVNTMKKIEVLTCHSHCTPGRTPFLRIVSCHPPHSHLGCLQNFLVYPSTFVEELSLMQLLHQTVN